jgi:hypothetical protein
MAGERPVLDGDARSACWRAIDRVALGPTQRSRRAQEHGVLLARRRVGERARGTLRLSGEGLYLVAKL